MFDDLLEICVGFSEGNTQAYSEGPTISKGVGSLFTAYPLGW